MLENSAYEGVSLLYREGIRHNDLHSRKIFLRNRQFVKTINFGKEFMVENPVYNIKLSEKKQKRYKNFHACLGYEPQINIFHRV